MEPNDKPRVDDTRVPLTPAEASAPAGPPAGPPPVPTAQSQDVRFVFEAQDGDGNRISGTISAPSALAVSDQLKASGCLPLDIRREDSIGPREETGEHNDDDSGSSSKRGCAGCVGAVLLILLVVGVSAAIAVVVLRDAVRVRLAEWRREIAGQAARVSPEKPAENATVNTPAAATPPTWEPDRTTAPDTHGGPRAGDVVLAGGDDPLRLRVEQDGCVVPLRDSARDRIEEGMAMADVRAITGKPASEISMGNRTTWLFHTYRVKFEDGRVTGILDRVPPTTAVINE